VNQAMSKYPTNKSSHFNTMFNYLWRQKMKIARVWTH